MQKLKLLTIKCYIVQGLKTLGASEGDLSFYWVRVKNLRKNTQEFHPLKNIGHMQKFH